MGNEIHIYFRSAGSKAFKEPLVFAHAQATSLQYTQNAIGNVPASALENSLNAQDHILGRTRSQDQINSHNDDVQVN